MIHNFLLPFQSFYMFPFHHRNFFLLLHILRFQSKLADSTRNNPSLSIHWRFLEADSTRHAIDSRSSRFREIIRRELDQQKRRIADERFWRRREPGINEMGKKGREIEKVKEEWNWDWWESNFESNWSSSDDNAWQERTASYSRLEIGMSNPRRQRERGNRLMEMKMVVGQMRQGNEMAEWEGRDRK